MKESLKQNFQLNAAGIPQKQGLYDPAFEHDSCGIGFVVRINGEPGHLIVDSDWMTSAKGVFAAGDCVSGASLVVRAIDQGRQAAEGVDLYLSEK